jgi:hypothetical protein
MISVFQFSTILEAGSFLQKAHCFCSTLSWYRTKGTRNCFKITNSLH